MATGGTNDKEVEEAKDKEVEEAKEKEDGKGVGSWAMSGLKIGAALKVGAVLGVTTLGAATLGVVAVGAYAALKIAQHIDLSPEDDEEESRSTLNNDAEQSKDEASHQPSLKPASEDGSGADREVSGSLIDKLNEYHHARISASSAKLMAIQDLVEKARQPLSSCLIEKHENLIQGELQPAAFDQFINKQQDERVLLLPLAFDHRMWEFTDTGNSVLEMPGCFCVHRVNLDAHSIGESPWDPYLNGSYLSPDLLQKFWKEKIECVLKEEEVFRLDYHIKLNAGSIELSIENPVKGYADMLCIKIIPCVKFEKGGELITIAAQSETPFQEPAALSSISPENLWHRSREEEAAQKMETLDADGGCRRKCLIILEGLLSTQPQMKMFSLYHMIAVLLKVCEEETEWDDEMLVERFLDLLKALEGQLRAGSLKDHFINKCCSPEDVIEAQKWVAHKLESEDRIPDLLDDLVFKVNKH